MQAGRGWEGVGGGAEGLGAWQGRQGLCMGGCEQGAGQARARPPLPPRATTHPLAPPAAVPDRPAAPPACLQALAKPGAGAGAAQREAYITAKYATRR